MITYLYIDRFSDDTEPGLILFLFAIEILIEVFLLSLVVSLIKFWFFS